MTVVTTRHTGWTGIEDLEALITAVGGSAAVFGYSSGGLLALLAALQGAAVARMAIYEPPIPLDDLRSQRPADLPEQLANLIAEGRNGDAVALYQTAAVGIPADVVDRMRQAPFWSALEAMAPSLVYDALVTQPGAIDAEKLQNLRTPTLVLSGSETWDQLARGADVIADVLPAAQRVVLKGGVGHDIDTAPVAPVLIEFLLS